MVAELQHVAAAELGRERPLDAAGASPPSSAHAPGSPTCSTSELAFVVGGAKPAGGQSAAMRSSLAPSASPAATIRTRYSAARRASPERLQARRAELVPGQPELADRQRVEHRRRAADVVEIGVGERERVEPPHPERAQRGQHHRASRVPARRVGARVDEPGVGPARTSTASP